MTEVIRLGAEEPAREPRKGLSRGAATLAALGVGFGAFGLMAYLARREPMVRGATFDTRR